jgi:hypothetical protein
MVELALARRREEERRRRRLQVESNLNQYLFEWRVPRAREASEQSGLRVGGWWAGETEDVEVFAASSAFQDNL